MPPATFMLQQSSSFAPLPRELISFASVTRRTSQHNISYIVGRDVTSSDTRQWISMLYMIDVLSFRLLKSLMAIIALMLLPLKLILDLLRGMSTQNRLFTSTPSVFFYSLDLKTTSRSSIAMFPRTYNFGILNPKHMLANKDLLAFLLIPLLEVVTSMGLIMTPFPLSSFFSSTCFEVACIDCIRTSFTSTLQSVFVLRLLIEVDGSSRFPCLTLLAKLLRNGLEGIRIHKLNRLCLDLALFFCVVRVTRRFHLFSMVHEAIPRQHSLVYLLSDTLKSGRIAYTI